jgi:hypothetical protein
LKSFDAKTTDESLKTATSHALKSAHNQNSHRDFSSSRKKNSSVGLQDLDRVQRMAKLWGSPDSVGDILTPSPLQSSKSSSVYQTSSSKVLSNRAVVPCKNVHRAASIRLQSSPQTPTALSSLIPRFTSPPAVVDALKMAHAHLKLSEPISTSSHRMFDGKAATSGSQKSFREISTELQSKHDIDPCHSDSLSSQTASQFSHSDESKRSTALSPYRRTGDVLLSSEELELKVFLDFCDFVFF